MGANDTSSPRASSRYGSLGRAFSSLPRYHLTGSGHFEVWSKCAKSTGRFAKAGF